MYPASKSGNGKMLPSLSTVRSYCSMNESARLGACVGHTVATRTSSVYAARNSSPGVLLARIDADVEA